LCFPKLSIEAMFSLKKYIFNVLQMTKLTLIIFFLKKKKLKKLLTQDSVVGHKTNAHRGSSVLDPWWPTSVRRGKKEKKNFLALSGEGEKKIMILVTQVRGISQCVFWEWVKPIKFRLMVDLRTSSPLWIFINLRMYTLNWIAHTPERRLIEGSWNLLCFQTLAAQTVTYIWPTSRVVNGCMYWIMNYDDCSESSDDNIGI